MTRLRGNSWWRIWWKLTDSCLPQSTFLLSTNQWGITPCCISWLKSLESSKLRRGAHFYFALKSIDQRRSPWNLSLMLSLCKGKSLTKLKCRINLTRTSRSSPIRMWQTLRTHFWRTLASLQKAKRRRNSQGQKLWQAHLLDHKPSILSATSKKRPWALTVHKIAIQIDILSTVVIMRVLRATKIQIRLYLHLTHPTNSKDYSLNTNCAQRSKKWLKRNSPSSNKWQIKEKSAKFSVTWQICVRQIPWPLQEPFKSLKEALSMPISSAMKSLRGEKEVQRKYKKTTFTRSTFLTHLLARKSSILWKRSIRLSRKILVSMEITWKLSLLTKDIDRLFRAQDQLSEGQDLHLWRI